MVTDELYDDLVICYKELEKKNEALLEACRDAQSMIEAFIDNDVDNMSDAEKVIRRLSQAIANATK